MKQFELQEPIYQLFDALKSHFFACELFSDTVGCSEQSNKTIKKRKNIFVTSSLYNSTTHVFGADSILLFTVLMVCELCLFLQTHLRQTELSLDNSDIYYRRLTLCHTLSGVPCQVLTITACPRAKDQHALNAFSK